CLRSPLAQGSSKVLAILGSSVMFFSLSSAMVMVTYKGMFKRGAGWDRFTPRGRAAGLFSQPAGVAQKRSPVQAEPLFAPNPQSGPIRYSWFPGWGCWACETYE